MDKANFELSRQISTWEIWVWFLFDLKLSREFRLSIFEFECNTQYSARCNSWQVQKLGWFFFAFSGKNGGEKFCLEKRKSKNGCFEFWLLHLFLLCFEFCGDDCFTYSCCVSLSVDARCLEGIFYSFFFSQSMVTTLCTHVFGTLPRGFIVIKTFTKDSGFFICPVSFQKGRTVSVSPSATVQHKTILRQYELKLKWMKETNTDWPHTVITPVPAGSCVIHVSFEKPFFEPRTIRTKLNNKKTFSASTFLKSYTFQSLEILSGWFWIKQGLLYPPPHLLAENKFANCFKGLDSRISKQKWTAQ